MKALNAGGAFLLLLLLGMSGCKEDKPEVPNPDCSKPGMADNSKCIRSEDNIIRSKPKPWTLN